MNYFAHAYTFLTETLDGPKTPDGPYKNPYLAVATGVPDMLTVVDRSVRLRRHQVEPYYNDPDSIVA